jgi:hypothetical protein
MLVRYKSEEEIRDELAHFDWDQLEDLDLEDDNDPEAVNAKYKLDMLLAIAGLDAEHRDHVAKPKLPSEVQMCKAIKEKLDARHEIVAGRGRFLLDDRMFVRQRLWEVMKDPATVYILHECVVYAPAEALEGVELIDAPGTGVVSPQEQKALQDVLETADAVVVCMQRNLEDCRDIKSAIQGCVQFQKFIESPTPGTCQVFLFSALDEQNNFTPLDTQKSILAFEKSKEEATLKNQKGLKQMIKKSMTDMQDSGRMLGHSAKDEKWIQDRLDALKENMFSSYPLLWASVAMSPGNDKPASLTCGGPQPEEKTSRARKAQLLDDVTRMLARISGRSAGEGKILQAFFDAVRLCVWAGGVGSACSNALDKKGE